MARRPVKIIRQEWADAQRSANLNGTWLACVQNPIPYVEIRPATAQDADDLCAGCPLREIHYEYAQATRADHEVAGGVYWIKGKPVT